MYKRFQNLIAEIYNNKKKDSFLLSRLMLARVVTMSHQWQEMRSSQSVRRDDRSNNVNSEFSVFCLFQDKMQFVKHQCEIRVKMIQKV